MTPRRCSSGSAPTTRRRRGCSSSSARSTTWRGRPAPRPTSSGSSPASTRCSIRAIDIAGNVDETPADADVDDRGRADRRDHVRPERPDPARPAGPAGPEHGGAGDLRVHLRSAGRDVRVLDRRVRVRALHVPVPGVRRRHRRPRVPGPRRQRDHDQRGRADRPGGADDATSGARCSGPTRRGRTPRSRTARTRRRSTRSPSSSSPAATTARRPRCSSSSARSTACRTTAASRPRSTATCCTAPHELLVRAIDLEGNVDITPARYTWNLVLPPEVTILTGPDEVVESTSATFTWTSTVPGSTYQCWLDGAIVDHDCTSPVELRRPGRRRPPVRRPGDLAAGPRRGSSGRSGSGRSATSRRRSRRSSPGRSSRRRPTRARTFTFSASKPSSTFMCSLDGREPEPCSSPLIYPAAARRSSTCSRSRRSRRGSSTASACRSSPTTTRSRRPTSGRSRTPRRRTRRSTGARRPRRRSTNAVFGLSSDDPTAVLECSLDGEGFSECDPVAEFTDLERGPHTLLVRARRPARQRRPDAGPA